MWLLAVKRHCECDRVLVLVLYRVIHALYSNSDTVEHLETGDMTPEQPEPHSITTNDLFIKDAFLVFRALCKLTMKPLATERSARFSGFSI
jgi:hypothetical protein